MESIYYVLSLPCQRRCIHCYEDRFRPYQGEELERVVGVSRSAFPAIIDHFPDRMSYRDFATGEERRGRVILAGGEVLLGAVRESVLSPALERLREKYRDAGGRSTSASRRWRRARLWSPASPRSSRRTA